MTWWLVFHDNMVSPRSVIGGWGEGGAQNIFLNIMQNIHQGERTLTALTQVRPTCSTPQPPVLNTQNSWCCFSTDYCPSVSSCVLAKQRQIYALTVQ